MIVLDASLLIAHFWSGDRHHETATRLLEEAVGDELLIHPLNLAEVLVGGVRAGRDRAMLLDLESLGVRVAQAVEGEPLRLATLRVASGLKLPDCCALDTAQRHAAALATLDSRLSAAARDVNVPVVASPS